MATNTVPPATVEAFVGPAAAAAAAANPEEPPGTSPVPAAAAPAAPLSAEQLEETFKNMMERAAEAGREAALAAAKEQPSSDGAADAAAAAADGTAPGSVSSSSAAGMTTPFAAPDEPLVSIDEETPGAFGGVSTSISTPPLDAREPFDPTADLVDSVFGTGGPEGRPQLVPPPRYVIPGGYDAPFDGRARGFEYPFRGGPPPPGGGGFGGGGGGGGGGDGPGGGGDLGPENFGASGNLGKRLLREFLDSDEHVIARAGIDAMNHDDPRTGLGDLFSRHEVGCIRNGNEARMRPIIGSEGIDPCMFEVVPLGPFAGKINVTQYVRGSAMLYFDAIVREKPTEQKAKEKAILLAFTRGCGNYFYGVKGTDLIPEQTRAWFPNERGICEVEPPSAEALRHFGAWKLPNDLKANAARFAVGDLLCSMICVTLYYHHWLSDLEDDSVPKASRKAHKNQYDSKDRMAALWELSQAEFDDVSLHKANHAKRDALCKELVKNEDARQRLKIAGLSAVIVRLPLNSDVVKALLATHKLVRTVRQMENELAVAIGPHIPIDQDEFVLACAQRGHAVKAGLTGESLRVAIAQGTKSDTAQFGGIFVPITAKEFAKLNMYEQDAIVESEQHGLVDLTAELAGLIKGFAEGSGGEAIDETDENSKRTMLGARSVKRAIAEAAGPYAKGLARGIACGKRSVQTLAVGVIPGVGLMGAPPPPPLEPVKDPNAVDVNAVIGALASRK